MEQNKDGRYTDPYDPSVIHTEIPRPRKTIYSKYIKRLLDILLSGIAILVLSPLLLLLCLLELIFHGRPIFYIDQRPGLDGKIFGLYKFRSMINEREKNGRVLEAHERITPFGRILRRTSLDELAGLFNIFNGTLSIIGPRPLMTEYLPLYSERHKYRHAVRPGLACWRIGGTNQLTAASWTWNAQFENDIYYVEHVSFLLDVKNVLKTVLVLFSGSDMRTNSDRIRFNGENLLETRPKHEIMEALEREQKAAAEKEKAEKQA